MSIFNPPLALFAIAASPVVIMAQTATPEAITLPVSGASVSVQGEAPPRPGRAYSFSGIRGQGIRVSLRSQTGAVGFRLYDSKGGQIDPYSAGGGASRNPVIFLPTTDTYTIRVFHGGTGGMFFTMKIDAH